MSYRKATQRRISFARVVRAVRRMRLRVHPVRAGTAGVSVWRIGLRASAATLRAMRGMLSRAERQRVARRRARAEWRRATLSFGLQRLLLGLALARRRRALRIVRQRYGKPVLALARDRWLRFNASHSGDTLLVALGGTRPLGIDIERRDHRKAPRVPARLLSAGERARLQLLDEDARPRAFLQLWTRKEAAAKADGSGFALGFANIHAWTPGIAQQAAQCWHTRDLSLGANHVGSLAVAQARRTA